MRILNADEVRKGLPMNRAIFAMEEAFSAFSSGKAESPLRTRIKVPGEETNYLFMPATYSSESGSPVVMKMVGINSHITRVGAPFRRCYR
jgi:ornithine cyclodeaminase/alanine dehydrogenase-like protein (mu-crystallin family)